MDILLVDDDPDMREVLGTFLTGGGHRVTAADRAQQALQHLRQKPFQFVLLDILMPEQNGVDLLKTIKAAFPQVVVVMMTASKDSELVMEAYRQGALDCLLKPIDMEYLKTQILDRIGKS